LVKQIHAALGNKNGTRIRFSILAWRFGLRFLR
jgi:hypothetical protein